MFIISLSFLLMDNHVEIYLPQLQYYNVSPSLWSLTGDLSQIHSLLYRMPQCLVFHLSRTIVSRPQSLLQEHWFVPWWDRLSGDILRLPLLKLCDNIHMFGLVHTTPRANFKLETDSIFSHTWMNRLCISRDHIAVHSPEFPHPQTECEQERLVRMIACATEVKLSSPKISVNNSSLLYW